ncbi:hypothetical protein RHMOL_Rhmol01G0031000 [Rhododendron molle]|uniref:Uncharacterized protein n=1 Tax=Rhododendron molle TaxID=49168 RepID=A0ACC0Q0T3_RHOML|nr:hypothetical protein RHMOL_Rhmol01G0031000 [Rhododendron molle]
MCRSCSFSIAIWMRQKFTMDASFVVVNLNWKDSPSSVLDSYHELIQSGVRILIFSSSSSSDPTAQQRLDGVSELPGKAFNGKEARDMYYRTITSGDIDSVIPVTSTGYRVNAVNLATVGPGYDDGQVGGWTQEYEGLTFVTVRGAGHEVPLHKPKQALTLFKSLLEGNSMPSFEHVSDS